VCDLCRTVRVSLGIATTTRLRPARRIDANGIIRRYDYMNATGYVILQVRHLLSHRFTTTGALTVLSWQPCNYTKFISSFITYNLFFLY